MTATYGTPRSLARDFANLPVSRENSEQMEKEEDARKDCLFLSLSYSSHMRFTVYIGLHNQLSSLSFRSALFSFTLATSLSFSLTIAYTRISDCAESRPVITPTQHPRQRNITKRVSPRDNFSRLILCARRDFSRK